MEALDSEIGRLRWYFAIGGDSPRQKPSADVRVLAELASDDTWRVHEAHPQETFPHVCLSAPLLHHFAAPPGRPAVAYEKKR